MPCCCVASAAFHPCSLGPHRPTGHSFVSPPLYLPGEFTHLSAFLFVGRCDQHSQQVAQRVYCQMHLAAFSSLVSVVTCSATALWATLKRAPIQDRGGWARVALRQQPSQLAQILDHGLKAASLPPAFGLLLHGRPRRQVVGQQPPGQPAFTIQRTASNNSRKGYWYAGQHPRVARSGRAQRTPTPHRSRRSDRLCSSLPAYLIPSA